MRLIDADAGSDVLQRMAENYRALGMPADEAGYATMARMLRNTGCLPTIDAVPVVRCKDCIYRGAYDLCPMCVRVHQLDEHGYLDCTVDDGFCHMGAKMAAKEENE